MVGFGNTLYSGSNMVVAVCRLAVIVWLFVGGRSALSADYYINNNSTAGDVFTSAVGNDSNAGTNAAAPKLTVTNLLSTVTLLPGDTVYIDTGVYSNYTVSITTAGSLASPIVFRGSTNAVAGGSIFVRNSAAADAWSLVNASNVILRDLTMRVAREGVSLNNSSGVRLERLLVGNNSRYGIYVNGNSHNAVIRNSIILNNDDYGIHAQSSTNCNVEFAVLWGTKGLWSRSNSDTTLVSNSVIRASGLGNFVYRRESAIRSDYNLFVLDDSAAMATLDGVAVSSIPRLADWQQAYTNDSQSAVLDPLFANTATTNFYPQSQYGRYVNGVFSNDAVTSPLIDMAGRGSAYTNETAPNGGRANIGRYGSTPEASRSPTNRTLLALTYNAGGLATGSAVRLSWVAGNAQTGDTVRLEYSLNGGSSWSLIVSNVPATNETATWNTSVHGSSGAAKWRVIYEAFPSITATNVGFFSIRNTNLAFYVNDSSSSGDIFTAGLGAATNIATSAQPSDSLASLLANHTVSGGDTVYVDTGLYTLTNTINMSVRSRGSSGNPVVIFGSTNFISGGAIFSRNNSTSDVFALNSIADVMFRNLTVQSGRYGFNLAGSPGITFDRVTFRDNTYAVQFASGSSNCWIRNCLMVSNLLGSVVNSSTRLRVENTTMYGLRGVTLQASGTLAFSNNIVRVSGSGAAAFEQLSGTFFEKPDHNLYWPEGGAAVAKFGVSTLTLMSEYQKLFDQDWNSTVMNPQFASVATNDFHLRSANGRWSGTSFVNDAETSPGIDLGGPGSVYTNESAPNGSRLNVGTYGNTVEASRSPTNARLVALTYTDGGVLNVPGDRIYWNYVGFPTGATVRIEYSGNSGASWSPVATNLAVTDGSYIWSNTNIPSSRLALWRVVYEANTNVSSAVTNIITLRNGVYRYYVNDGSTVGDVYCSGIGNNSNLGTTPDLPKATIEAVLAAYVLSAGDIIYVDTGLFQSSTTITISPSQSGTNGNPSVIQGSTNVLAGGTIIRGPSSPPNAPAFTMGSGLQDFTLRDITVQRRTHGVSIGAATRITLERVNTESNSQSGVYIENAVNTTLRNVASRMNAQDGIYVVGGTNLTVLHSVLWMNSSNGINTANTRVYVTNCILGARGANAIIYSAPGFTNIFANYNNLYVEQDASVAAVGTLDRLMNSLSSWQIESGQDRSSMDADPLFANADGRDFHLRSQTVQGRFDPLLGWVTDTTTSPLIDAGDPTAAFSAEPAPNGSRADIGLYGNTPEASRTDFPRLGVGNLRQGGWVRGTSTLHWVAAGLATSDLVRVDVSPDGGETWNIFSTGTLASLEHLSWNTTSTNATPAALWRVTSLSNTGLTSQTTNFFAIRNTPLTYYVNDNSNVSNLFTGAVGASTNWVASSNRPMDSVATIFDRFDLEPGDRILVDRGSYAVGSGITIGRRDSGAPTSMVTVAGATACGLGGAPDAELVGTLSLSSTGIRMDYARDVVISNLVIRRAGAGVRATRVNRINFEGMRILNSSSNGMELNFVSNVMVRRSVLAHNNSYGLFGITNQAVYFINSMLWSNTSGGVLHYAGDLSITNSVLHTSGNGRSLLYIENSGLVRADFNNLVTENDSDIARYNGRLYKYPASWQEGTTNDLHSLSHTPGFASVADSDYHLLSQSGRYNQATCSLTPDSTSSVMIDSGDPTFNFSSEPLPNGGIRDIGVYGNHPEASLSPTNARLLVLSLNRGGTVRGTNTIYWSANAAAASHLVHIDVSLDGGFTWTNVATNVNASAGSLIWDASALPSSAAGKWRITSQNDPSVARTNEVLFTLNNGSISYYVNDTNTAGDVYCSAPGSAANDGLAPNSPAASLKQIFDRYLPGPGDFVLVDSGHYFVTNTVSLDGNFSGSSTNPVTIKGSTNWVVGGSRFDLNRSGPLVSMSSLSNFVVRDLVITNARRGITMQLGSNIRLQNIHVRGLRDLLDVGVPPISGIVIDSSDNITLDRLVVQNVTNTSFSAGILLGALPTPNPQSNSIQMLNCVLWSNTYALRSTVSSRMIISNTVIQSFGANAVGIDAAAGSTILGGYNNYRAENGAVPIQIANIISPALPTPPAVSAPVQYFDVDAWGRAQGSDTNSLNHDPGFADPGAMDFSLLSRSGRFTVSGLVVDAVSSVMLDGGSPTASYTNEPLPNGARINMGVLGDTPRASLSDTNRSLVLLTLNDGGYAYGSNYLVRWDWRGTVTPDTLQFWYSNDGGGSWSILATNVVATQRWYSWNTRLQASGFDRRIRLVSASDPSVSVQSERSFAVRNTNFTFYVNDNSTTGDVYTSAIGNSLANGLTPATPLDSLRSLLTTYDLEAGDTVYVDTGVYPLTSTLTIGQNDTGDATNLVSIIGSTNEAAGGSVFQDAGIQILNGRGLSLQHVTVAPVSKFIPAGLAIVSSTNIQARFIRVRNTGSGIAVRESAGISLSHCVVVGALTNGLDLDKARNLTFSHGVVLSNQLYGFSAISDLTVTHSILGANGSGRFVYGGTSNNTFAANYNAYLLENGGRLAKVQFGVPPEPFPREYNNMSKWVGDLGRDVNSLAVDPLLADISRGNYFPQSQGGRWEPTTNVWVLDAQTSPLIDTGDPFASFTNEPSPNGSRLNIGIYGGTSLASKTPTNASFVIGSINDGGSISGTNTLLYWIARGAAVSHTVRVEFSGDDGITWTVLASNLMAGSSTYTWDTTTIPSTVLGRWRVVSEASTGVWSQTYNAFAVRNGPVSFYLNDSSTNGDLYTTAVGSDAQNGATPSTPMRSMKSLLERYDLEPGDVLYADTGVYTNTSTITIDQLDAGFRLLASTNSYAGGTWFVFTNVTEGIRLFQAGNTEIQNLRMRGASTLITVLETPDVVLRRLELVGGDTALSATRSARLGLRNSVIRNAATGLRMSLSTEAVLENNVLWSNTTAGIAFIESSAYLYNSIFGVLGQPDRFAFTLDRSTLLASDYNAYYLAQGGLLARKAITGTSYATKWDRVATWSRDTGFDVHSFGGDPGLYAPDNSDFHLRSQAGRYDLATGTIVNDTNTSVLIDAGYPLSDYSMEPAAHGARVDIGLYGNHPEASRSITNARLNVVRLNDGGRAEGGLVPLTWTALGAATGHLVRLDYSLNGGSSWSTIQSNVPANAELFYWDTYTAATWRAAWRLVSEVNTSVTDQTEQVFQLRNSPLSLYVNDDFTNGDIYASAIGLPENTGLTPASPRRSLQTVIDDYDLEPGDTVYMDTGEYILSAGVDVGRFDGWNDMSDLSSLTDEGYSVRIRGSTNMVAGGTRIIAFGTDYGIKLYDVVGFNLSLFGIAHFPAGSGISVEADTAPNSLFEWLRLKDGATGVSLRDAENSRLTQSIIAGFGTAGFNVRESSGISMTQCILWSNQIGATVSAGGELNGRNNVLVSLRTDSVGWQRNNDALPTEYGLLDANYNVFWSIPSAFVAELTGRQYPGQRRRFQKLINWQRDSGLDFNSVHSDPRFANQPAGDYHPQSPYGRFVDGLGYITNLPDSFSPLIDSGDPALPYSREPTPNSQRANAGVYGNQEEASKSSTNGTLRVLTLNDGGSASGLIELRWSASGSVLSHAVTLEFSADGGATWSNIAVNVPAVEQFYLWDSEPYGRAAAGLWRITSQTTTSLTSQTENFFALRQGGTIPYYVNDANTAGDVYCTAAGNNANNGFLPATPKATLQGLLDAVDLEPGDVVYIDTGLYSANVTPVVGELDSGESTNAVIFRGSTNAAAGGTVFDRITQQGSALSFDRAEGITVRDITFRNGQYGVHMEFSKAIQIRNSKLLNNRDDAIRVEGSTEAVIANNVIWNNGTNGIHVLLKQGAGLFSGGSATIENNTIWGNPIALRLGLSSVTEIRNNLIQANGPDSRMFFLAEGITNVVSDYNAFYRQAGALMAERQTQVGGNEFYGRLQDWQIGFGNDYRSLTHDPLVADDLNGDFHLQSAAGRFTGPGVMTNDIAGLYSPLLDAGRPASAWTNESAPNGGRVNIGAYGNTAQASRSRTNGWLLALSLNDGGKIAGSGNVMRWAAGGWSTNSKVRFEYAREGVDFVVVASNVPVYQDGFTWDVSQEAVTQLARWRVVNEDDTNVVSGVNNTFVIKNDCIAVYVNDEGTDGDVYTMAPGSVTNSGLHPTSPLNSVEAALDQFPLGACDTVYVDTGTYYVTNELGMRLGLIGDTLKSGLPGDPIRIVGSTNYVYGGSLVVGAPQAAAVMQIINTKYIQIDHLRLMGATNGLWLSGTENVDVNWVECFTNRYGFNLNNAANVTLKHCVAWNNQWWGLTMAGLYSSANWNYGVMYSNGLGAIQHTYGPLSVSNSILAATVSNSVLYSISGTFAQSLGDYNVYWPSYNTVLMKDTFSSVSYPSVRSWQVGRGMDEHSFVADPSFIDPDYGDFHLQSEVGRYVPSVDSFVNDPITSWAIDAAGPADPYNLEPAPNGARANTGRYGNTAEASKSSTNKELFVVSLRDGGTAASPQPLIWLARGMNSGDTVRIEYTPNKGLAWSTLATNISALQQYFLWENSLLPSTPLSQWRVSLESNPSVQSTNERVFTIRNGPIFYYVNDSNTVGDIYTTAVGDPLNDGITVSTAVDSVSRILDAYDLEGGDVVFVDTGLYPVTNDIMVLASDSGVATNRTRIQGSVNRLAGGSVFQRVSTNAYGSLTNDAVFQLIRASHMELSDLVIENANLGVFINNKEPATTDNVLCQRLTIRNGGRAGVFCQYSNSNTFDRVVVRGMQGLGMQLSRSEGTRIISSVIWSNSGSAVEVTLGSLRMTNSVLQAYGPTTNAALVLDETWVRSDYNNYFVEGDASYAVINGEPIDGLPQLTQRTTQDVHSISVDPLFEDPASDNFYPRSELGRYDPIFETFVTTDTNTSWLVDTGDPASSYASEPAPNGFRRNVGYDGGTTEASKGRTNEWLLAVTAMAGGRIGNIFPLIWFYGNLDETNRVDLHYSLDGGTNWIPIISNLPINQDGYIWNSLNADPYQGPTTLWRVQLSDRTNIVDQTDRTFGLNGPFTFFVNDNDLIDDEFTTAVGNDANLGVSSNAPKATLRSVLDSWDIDPADTILIDHGTYVYGSNDLAFVRLGNQGTPSEPVIIRGSTNGVIWDAFGITIPGQSGPGIGPAVLTIEAPYIEAEGFTLNSASIDATATNVHLRQISTSYGDLNLIGPDSSLSDFEMSNATVSVVGSNNVVQRGYVRNGSMELVGWGAVLKNVVVTGSKTPLVEIGGSSITVENNTMIADRTAIQQTGNDSLSTVRNNIIIANGSGGTAYCLERLGGVIRSDYNLFQTRNGAWLGNAQDGLWEKLVYWQQKSGQDTNSMVADPLFVNEGGGDYHLKSTSGRYAAGSWVVDAVHSPAIDAGAPLSDYQYEPAPNGSRVNIGAYGNTSEASKSLSNAWLMAQSFNDGGVARGTNVLRWLSGGLVSTNTVTLQYSSNGGSTWSNLSSGVSALGGVYTWDTTLSVNSLDARWRIILDGNTNVWDQTDGLFNLRNDTRAFYINNHATAGDVFTLAVGSSANDGRTPATPKDSLIDLLATYDTEPHDTIYMDTGVYTSTLVQIIWSRGGNSNGVVTIRGSTNAAAGGTVLRRNTKSGDGVLLNASYVTLQDLIIENANRAIFVETSTWNRLERLGYRSNNVGVVISGGSDHLLASSWLWNNAEGGVWVQSSPNAAVQNMTFVNNLPYSLRMDDAPGAVIQNNIFYHDTATSNEQSAISGATGTIYNTFIDYNIYYFGTTPLSNTFIYGSFTNLLTWQRTRNKDFRSAITNPLMQDVVSGDFHLKSQRGRFQPSTMSFVTDSNTSWGVDHGNPYSSFTNEPTPNGGRVNIGAYGNTWQASKGSTGLVVEVQTGNSYLPLTENENPYPLVWYLLNAPFDFNVSVQYSGDGGNEWLTILSGIPAYQEYIVWTNSPSYNSFNARWRIVGEGGGSTNYWDINNDQIRTFFGVHRISAIAPDSNGYTRIVWRGAWDEDYQIQYATNVLATNSLHNWQNLVNVTNLVVGGDTPFVDLQSPQPNFRVYRVLWLGTNGIPYR